jgi:acyl-CoA synthetase (NDP forming)
MMESTWRLVLEPDAIRVLEQYNIPYPEHGLARSPEEAARIAGELGYPVVLKVVSPHVVHKSDAGGVIVGIEEAKEVHSAYGRILDGVRTAVPRARIEGALVCKQAPEGLEVIVGGLDDATFGPTVMFGLGGVFAEALEDVSFRIAPLERRDAEEMVTEIKGYSLLMGARGQAGCDVSAVTDLLMAVSQMVTDHPEIKELDLNPVRVYEKGLMVLDARMMERRGDEARRQGA